MRPTPTQVLPQIVVIVLLVLALFGHFHYGFYMFLRLVVFGVFVFLALKASKLEKQNWVWICGITAIVYNPFMPLHLNRGLWSIINLATIAVAFGSMSLIRQVPKE
ncbi:hypothetical protein SAMN05444156_2180 [Verrucomicrobium sp. GAS474]|uniref:DUF6804 family protein n=1 Tax=Verrucomicrobium sp. GAS474 TaxID=1882831 RepID=UPI00087A866C|nr:DUF6804 family protein [Verrucomicrobium sp. GAS474]SDU13716.1 hypothetical protein SAMN05444156_2180 [Verrucomicrobium sp. GAS474]